MSKPVCRVLGEEGAGVVSTLVHWDGPQEPPLSPNAELKELKEQCWEERLGMQCRLDKGASVASLSPQ